jgi:hypothetical protein
VAVLRHCTANRTGSVVREECENVVLTALRFQHGAVQLGSLFSKPVDDLLMGGHRIVFGFSPRLNSSGLNNGQARRDRFCF